MDKIYHEYHVWLWLYSIGKIATHLRYPTLTIKDPHGPMLEAIVQQLLNRVCDAQYPKIVKAKSRIGIDGNEHAYVMTSEAAGVVAKCAQVWSCLHHMSIPRPYQVPQNKSAW